ncbi:MAG: 3-isopropylmalate dehydrogenase [Gemmatimonadaceae bacterium]|jgi:3-isopropylmalate dehydrogenase|nr:3-isopropylmalate dehydrogenase [Gemmatimonadaceae bacterium]
MNVRRAFRVAVLAGDGVGPEVTREAVHVLSEVLHAAGHAVECTEALIGGAAIDATGEPFPPATREAVRHADAVLLGAVGGAKWNTQPPTLRPEAGLLALRKALGTFANLRPVRTLPAMVDATPLRPEIVRDTDILFVRELTGGAYFGAKSRVADATGGEVATDDWRYTTAEIERVVRIAGSLARVRRGHVTSVDKANVLATSQLWRDVTTRVLREEFADVTLVHAYVDAFAMQLLREPRAYDVVVTENLFGDILTDEAAVLAGSIGLLPSASLGAERADGTRVGLYEPIHGSAPDIAGRDIANPIGAIASVGLMLRYSLGLPALADEVDAAVQAALASRARTRDLVTADEVSLGTRAMGAAVRACVGAVALER